MFRTGSYSNEKNDSLDFFHDQLRDPLLQPLTKTTLKSKESQVVDHLHQSTEIRHFVKIGIFQLVQRVSSKLLISVFWGFVCFHKKNKTWKILVKIGIEQSLQNKNYFLTEQSHI